MQVHHSESKDKFTYKINLQGYMVGMVMLDFTGNGSLICASNSAQIAMHILKTDCNCIKIKTSSI